MKDRNGVDIKEGNFVVLPVSWGSAYLTSAEVIGLSEEKNELYVLFSGTPKYQWVDNNVLIFSPFPKPLGNKNIDCFGQEVMVGDQVAYRKPRRPIKFAQVAEIKEDNVFVLSTGEEVRGISIYKKGN